MHVYDDFLVFPKMEDLKRHLLNQEFLRFSLVR